MVSFRKKTPDREFLLSSPRKEDTEKSKSLKKRFTKIFQKTKSSSQLQKFDYGLNVSIGKPPDADLDYPTPPSTPSNPEESSLSVKVLATNSPSPSEDDDSRSYSATTISDLTSLQRTASRSKTKPDTNKTVPTKVSAADKLPTEDRSDRQRTVTALTRVHTPERTSNGLCHATEGFTSLFGIVEEACAPLSLPTLPTAAKSRTHRPDWGVAPSAEEEEEEDVETLEETIGETMFVPLEQSRKLGAGSGSTNTDTTQSTQHENFELVLDPAVFVSREVARELQAEQEEHHNEEKEDLQSLVGSHDPPESSKKTTSFATATAASATIPASALKPSIKRSARWTIRGNHHHDDEKKDDGTSSEVGSAALSEATNKSSNSLFYRLKRSVANPRRSPDFPSLTKSDPPAPKAGLPNEESSVAAFPIVPDPPAIQRTNDTEDSATEGASTLLGEEFLEDLTITTARSDGSQLHMKGVSVAAATAAGMTTALNDDETIEVSVEDPKSNHWMAEQRKEAEEELSVGVEVTEVIEATKLSTNTKRTLPIDSSNNNPIEKRTRSWQKLKVQLSKSSDDKNNNKNEVINRSSSSPEKPFGNEQDPKLSWREVVDPTSGRTYYYHRLTRKTTWSKPPGFEELDQPRQRANKATIWDDATKYKSGVDPTTGRTYYYHRMTRITTWTKPPGFQEPGTSKDQETKQDENDLEEDIIQEFKEISSAEGTTEANGEASALLDGDQSGAVLACGSFVGGINLDDTVEGNTTEMGLNGKKKEISVILSKMQPPDDNAVMDLMSQYDGREDELLSQLRDLVKSRPFDEPCDPAQTLGSDDSLVSEGQSFSAPSTLSSRSQSTNTALTGRTEKTQKISNTTSTNRSLFDTIKEMEEDSADTSITSKNDQEEEEEEEEEEANRPSYVGRRPLRTAHKSGPERTRDLRVEEFTSNRWGLKTETATNAVARSKRRDPSPQGGGIARRYDREAAGLLTENDDDAETFADTISALSAPDVEFDNRRSNFDKARRKTLNDAIKNKDWDLAASVTEYLLNAAQGGGVTNNRNERSTRQFGTNSGHGELNQRDLDRYVTENDWNSVAKYIAQKRAGGTQSRPPMYGEQHNPLPFPATVPATVPPTPSVPQQAVVPKQYQNRNEAIVGGTPTPTPTNAGNGESRIQKRFGARSQLQHRHNGGSLSSWDSDSEYESYAEGEGDDYSSQSDDSYEAAKLTGMTYQRKEFAC